ncbi:MAG TPA: DUF805 domain-containing protein [Steroidobacteraceae bacterium]|jgi:uncharacterized membrane protein YhaH (DUF805 family)
MGFVQAISTGFTKYVNFRDRACRSEFWYWALFLNIVSIVALIIDGALNTHLGLTVFFLVTYIPNIAIGVRRLHDLDASGWWILLSFIPIIGMIALLIWFATKGTDGPNRFGQDPLESPLPNQQFGAPA